MKRLREQGPGSGGQGRVRSRMHREVCGVRTRDGSTLRSKMWV